MHGCFEMQGREACKLQGLEGPTSIVALNVTKSHPDNELPYDGSNLAPDIKPQIYTSTSTN